MGQIQGRYALIQFCPVPERLEFLNIGVLIMVPERNLFGVRFARGNARIDRAFGRQSKSYLDALKEGFESRLRYELARDSEQAFAEFSRKRANEVRLSPLLPIMVGDLEADLQRLFDELVGDEDRSSREPRIRRKLREAFRAEHVQHLLEVPDEVDLPEYGMKVNVPYGYQNGCYNLIDGMRVPSSIADGLREAGKRAMEGGLIWKHFQDGPACKRLVVVGDFSQQSNAFYHAVQEQFEQAHVGLYRLDDMRPLYQDIIENAAVHGVAN